MVPMAFLMVWSDENGYNTCVKSALTTKTRNRKVFNLYVSFVRKKCTFLAWYLSKIAELSKIYKNVSTKFKEYDKPQLKIHYFFLPKDAFDNVYKQWSLYSSHNDLIIPMNG